MKRTSDLRGLTCLLHRPEKETGIGGAVMFLLRHFRLFKLEGMSEKAFSSAQYSVVHEHRV